MSEWNEKEVTPAKIDKFLKIHGKRGIKTLALLGRYTDIYNFSSSEVGTQFLKKIMVEMEALLDKVIDCKASDYEKMRYQALSSVFTDLAEVIGSYLKAKEKITG